MLILGSLFYSPTADNADLRMASHWNSVWNELLGNRK